MADVGKGYRGYSHLLKECQVIVFSKVFPQNILSNSFLLGSAPPPEDDAAPPENHPRSFSVLLDLCFFH